MGVAFCKHGYVVMLVITMLRMKGRICTSMEEDHEEPLFNNNEEMWYLTTWRVKACHGDRLEIFFVLLLTISLGWTCGSGAA